MKINFFTRLSAPCLSLFILIPTHAKNIFVATMDGSDNNPGLISAPLKTIEKAATLLTAGDTCIIRGGTYREFIKIPGGGTNEQTRITYKAYKSETPVLTGSELVTSWVSQGNNIYTAEISNTIFGTSNPFATNLTDPNGWLSHGKEYHLGSIWVNGDSYYERLTQIDMNAKPKSFWASINSTSTTLYLNYSGTGNPNTDTTEISVRPIVIQVSKTANCNYVTLDGLTIHHGATNWSSNEGVFDAMIDLNSAGWWIIQNCHISDGRTCGVQGGYGPGHHIIRHNLIERFGQAGLVGNKNGWFSSLVENNIFQDINVKPEFGGSESAAIKNHLVVDLVIRNNIFRRVYTHFSNWTFAIWLDWRCQNNRITGNIFTEMHGLATVELEFSHGPNIVDNNIFVQSLETPYAVRHNSSNIMVMHNLFVNSKDGHYDQDAGMSLNWYTPHTNLLAGGDKLTDKSALPITRTGDKYYNNIFINSNNLMPKHIGYTTNQNAFLQSSTPSTWGDSTSYNNSSFNSKLIVNNTDTSSTVKFDVDAGTVSLNCPIITQSLLGNIQPINAPLENPDGTAFKVDVDLYGHTRDLNQPKVGPIENLIIGSNEVNLIAGATKNGKTNTAVRGRKKSPAHSPIPFYGASIELTPELSSKQNSTNQIFNLNGRNKSW